MRRRAAHIDALRGVAILTMVLDHVLAMVEPSHWLRFTVTRVSLPLFVAAAVWALRGPVSVRRAAALSGLVLAETVLNPVIGLAMPGPVLLILVTLVVVGTRWGRRWLPVLGVAGLIQALYVPVPWSGYQPGLVMAWAALGLPLAAAVGSWRTDWPGWLQAVGRRPREWYVGHLAVLAAVSGGVAVVAWLGATIIGTAVAVLGWRRRREGDQARGYVWRIGLVLLIAIGSIPSVAGPAEATPSAPAFVPPDGVCVDAVTCADEAIWVLWNAKDPTWWSMAFANIGHLIDELTSMPMEEGEYGCAYPQGPIGQNDPRYRACVARVKSEIAFQLWTHTSAAEKEAACDLFPWIKYCDRVALPDGPYEEVLEGLGVTAYLERYEPQGAPIRVDGAQVALPGVTTSTGGAISFFSNGSGLYPGLEWKWFIGTGEPENGHWKLSYDNGDLLLFAAGLETYPNQRVAIIPQQWFRRTETWAHYVISWSADGLFEVWVDGTLRRSVSVPDAAGVVNTPVYVGGRPNEPADCDSNCRRRRHYGAIRRLAFHSRSLTQLEVASLASHITTPDILDPGPWEPLPPLIPGEEPLPEPEVEPLPSTTEVPPAPPMPDPLPAPDPNLSEEERQTGLLENLVTGVRDGFNWLGNTVGGLLRSIVDALTWLGDIFGYWIRWLWDRVGALLRSIRSVIVELTRVVTDLLTRLLAAIQTGLGLVVDAVVNLGGLIVSLPSMIVQGLSGLLGAIPAMILEGIEALFVPSIEVDLADECTSSFPCSWVVEGVDAGSALVGLIGGTSSCVTPSFSMPAAEMHDGFEASLPAPSGCAGGNGAEIDRDSGDLLGLRAPLRAFATLLLWLGVVNLLLSRVPWGRPDDGPLGAT